MSKFIRCFHAAIYPQFIKNISLIPTVKTTIKRAMQYFFADPISAVMTGHDEDHDRTVEIEEIFEACNYLTTAQHYLKCQKHPLKPSIYETF